MRGAQKAFIIIGMIFGFWYILPLIFGIKTLNRLKAGEKLTTGNKVCVLLFVNTIAGILLLCDKNA